MTDFISIGQISFGKYNRASKSFSKKTLEKKLDDLFLDALSRFVLVVVFATKVRTGMAAGQFLFSAELAAESETPGSSAIDDLVLSHINSSPNKVARAMPLRDPNSGEVIPRKFRTLQKGVNRGRVQTELVGRKGVYKYTIDKFSAWHFKNILNGTAIVKTGEKDMIGYINRNVEEYLNEIDYFESLDPFIFKCWKFKRTLRTE